jgi:hypothetical protein
LFLSCWPVVLVIVLSRRFCKLPGVPECNHRSTLVHMSTTCLAAPISLSLGSSWPITTSHPPLPTQNCTTHLPLTARHSEYFFFSAHILASADICILCADPPLRPCLLRFPAPLFVPSFRTFIPSLAHSSIFAYTRRENDWISLYYPANVEFLTPFASPSLCLSKVHPAAVSLDPQPLDVNTVHPRCPCRA